VENERLSAKTWQEGKGGVRSELLGQDRGLWAQLIGFAEGKMGFPEENSETFGSKKKKMVLCQHQTKNRLDVPRGEEKKVPVHNSMLDGG